MMRRPFKEVRPIGPFSIRDPDPNPEGSMVIAKIDVTGADEVSGTLDPEFEEDMVNVIADGVAEATSGRGTMNPPTPINFDEAVMFQVFPVSVGQEFQKAILAMMYDENLVRQEQNIQDMIELRTSRVERIDVFPL